jgi:AsmA protein
MRLGAKGAVGLFCALAVVASAAYHWPIRSATVAAQINETISPRLGLQWRGPANANFALLPWPTLRVIGLDLVDASGRSVLSAPAAKLELSLVGLLHGRFVPISATLRSPTALVDLDAAPLAFAQERAGSDGGLSGPPALWSHVRLRGGLLRVVSAARGFDTLIENVEGVVDWPSIDRPCALALTGAWRDETVRISGSVDSPSEALDGRPTGLRLAIDSHPLDLTLNGTWNGQPAGGFTGDVSARARSLGALERILGEPAAAANADASLSFEGKAQTSGAAISLSEARFAFDGQTFDGALNLSREGRRTAISGTLAADALKIDALVGPPPDALAQDGGWSRKPIASVPSPDLDLDLRFSAAHAEWGGHRVEDAAGSLMSHGGVFTAKLLDANAYQGVLKGVLTLSKGSGGLETQLTASMTDADIGAALTDFGWTGYRGRGGLAVSLRSTGAVPADAVASLEGTASIDLQAGAVEGVSIEEAMRRSQRRTVDVSRDMATGETTFTRARAQFAVAAGNATITEASVEGPGALLALEGSIDIPARRLHARLVATQADAQGAPSVDAARLTIVLSGPWSAPAVATAPGG